MVSTDILGRFARLSGWQRALLAEALATLTLASVAIRILPFRRVVERAASRERLSRAGARTEREILQQARWAVDAAADRVPWKAVCFQRGLTLHLMLRRRGVPSLLHYGVAQTPDRGLAAHVWVSLHGQIVMGAEEAPRFACLATFPAGPAQ